MKSGRPRPTTVDHHQLYLCTRELFAFFRDSMRVIMAGPPPVIPETAALISGQ
jgi:hypothetical protein